MNIRHPMPNAFITLIVTVFLCLTASVNAENKPEQVPERPIGTVLTGIDVLVRDGFQPLNGQRIGLITNHTGIDRAGNSTVERLYRAPNVNLVALFSPEHGLEGKLDIPEIGNSTDTETGIPVYSLYGETRKPTPQMLEGIDVLVFDIQDIGTRYYTYISTLGLAMEAASVSAVGFMVLDRPNPINGATVSGPMTDPGRTSFTAFHSLPVRHGMTVAELARLFRSERALDLDLRVIPLEGWNRKDYFDRTGLRWVNPSPNMRSLTQALLYPGIGLLETTNLSVGRGTDTPFEIVGAPWLDGEAFARELNRLELPGAAFVPIRFTPNASKFTNEPCGGVNLLVTDRARFDPLRTGLEMAVALRRMYPDTWDIGSYDRLLVSAGTLKGIRSGEDYDTIRERFFPELARFIERRSPYLIYP